jgi:hypothetical protein
LLVEEALRRSEFGLIDFHDSAAGRQAYIQGSSLAVWEVILVARAYDLDAEATAKHLQWPVGKVRAALQYSASFPREIDTAITDNESIGFTELSQLLPNAELFEPSHHSSKSGQNSRSRIVA